MLKSATVRLCLQLVTHCFILEIFELSCDQIFSRLRREFRDVPHLTMVRVRVRVRVRVLNDSGMLT